MTTENIIQHLESADKVLISASNGLSIAEGFHIFADDKNFNDYFSSFKQEYLIHNVVEGLFYPYPSELIYWKFYSKLYQYFLADYQLSEVMKNLYELISDKNYFVITSNIDNHFEYSGFENSKIFEVEGNCKTVQCAHACHNKLYDISELLLKINNNFDDQTLVNILPKCPQCHGPMAMHIETNNYFIKHEDWKLQAQAFEHFIHTTNEEKIVVLELGIGKRNQLIKAPIMQWIQQRDNVVYITFNLAQEIFIPLAIQDKSLSVPGDIAHNLSELVTFKRQGKGCTNEY
ncbi:Sir2 family NAD-dependent protein deacetylase [Staphylococcus shinii]|uniref:Sir2 family NAD-dependent protein deacetylase n=1 Tax=Staphylococcus shinii TaxID=2912228 RepID=UPI003CF7EF02